jgi:hypothetical protein
MATISLNKGVVTTINNYAQYASHEALEATTKMIFSAQEMIPLLDEIRKIEVATPDSREYEVRRILEG